MNVGTYAHAYSWNLEKKYVDFFYFLKAFLSLKWDKYSTFGVFVLGFPLSFYWLSGVKWIRMQDVKPQTLVETFEQANYNSIPEYNVALITLLTYPVNMQSWAYLPRYEETANYFTKDHNRREIELSCNSAHTQAEGRNWYWWRYNRFSRSEGCTSRPLTSLMAPLFYFLPETVCTLPIVFIYRKWPAENARDGISFPRPEIWKISRGSMTPAAPLVWGALGSLTFLPLRAPSKSHATLPTTGIL